MKIENKVEYYVRLGTHWLWQPESDHFSEKPTLYEIPDRASFYDDGVKAAQVARHFGGTLVKATTTYEVLDYEAIALPDEYEAEDQGGHEGTHDERFT